MKQLNTPRMGQRKEHRAMYSMDIDRFNLPEGCELRNFDGDLQLVGIGMTGEKYQEIRKGFPADIQGRLLGWKRIGR